MAGEVVGEPDAVVREAVLAGGERDREVAVLEQVLGGGDARGAGADDQDAARAAAAAGLRRACGAP